MRVPRIRLAALALVSGIALSGCAYDMYGDDYGYGYGPYGYGYPRSGVSIGIGYGGYGYPYGSYGYGYPYGGYGGYGGYGYDPFGWYGNYYYPGTGIYVYDRYRHRHQWSDDQRRYWEQRSQYWRDHHSGTTTGTTIGGGENWSGWDRSHWRDRHGSTTTVTTTTSDGSWTRGSGRWNRGGWQGGSPATTSGGERTRGASGDHPNRGHSHDRGTDRE
jgi:hypothetical protein